MKVLLDTDIGNDIDDAVCLDYLLRNASCELLGVTTVTAGAVERAKLASALCLRHGRDDVPVVAGADRPLNREPLQEPPFSQVGDWPHRPPDSRDAVGFLREVIDAHPGEVTLLAIGALTNVAALLASRPPLKSLVLMGGRFLSAGQEWNIRNDPDAARTVFDADLPHLRAVGLDVTRQVGMDSTAFRGAISGPLLDFAGPWLRLRDTGYFHDPLAAVTIFKPVCGYEKGRITVSNEDTLFEPDPAGPHEIATTVDQQAFFAELG